MCCAGSSATPTRWRASTRRWRCDPGDSTPSQSRRRIARAAAAGRGPCLLRAHPRGLARSSDARANRGAALATLGRHEEALADFDAVLAAAPHPLAAYNRGLALAVLGRPDEAVEAYDRSLGMMPNHVPALSSRGVALQALNRHAEAIESFDRALALTPDLPMRISTDRSRCWRPATTRAARRNTNGAGSARARPRGRISAGRCGSARPRSPTGRSCCTPSRGSATPSCSRAMSARWCAPARRWCSRCIPSSRR